jgi:hypothetical protein
MPSESDSGHEICDGGQLADAVAERVVLVRQVGADVLRVGGRDRPVVARTFTTTGAFVAYAV